MNEPEWAMYPATTGVEKQQGSIPDMRLYATRSNQCPATRRSAVFSVSAEFYGQADVKPANGRLTLKA